MPEDAPPPQAGLRVKTLEIAEWRAGQPDAISHLEQALPRPTSIIPRRVRLVRASGQRGRAYYVTDRSLRAVEVLERAGAAVGDTDAQSAACVEAVAAMAGMR